MRAWDFSVCIASAGSRSIIQGRPGNERKSGTQDKKRFTAVRLQVEQIQLVANIA
jgi:hypothetical protein